MDNETTIEEIAGELNEAEQAIAAGMKVQDLDAGEEAPKIDAEHEEKVKRVQEINEKMKAFVADMAENHDFKIITFGFDETLEQVGIWKSENVNDFDKLAFSKLAEQL